MTRIKAHSLTGRINLLSLGESFGCVRRNRGAAGIDRVSIKLYGGQLLQNLKALERHLKDGTYQSLPWRRVHIPKGNTGETRPLGIPAVADRVAQEEVRFLLNPFFEGIFHDDSYGFRPRRGCHMAVRRVLELKRASTMCWMPTSKGSSIAHVDTPPKNATAGAYRPAAA